MPSGVSWRVRGVQAALFDQHMQGTCPAGRQSADVILPAQVGKLITHPGISGRIDDFLDGLFGLIWIAADQYDLGIRGCSQLPGNGLTHRAGRAGDQKDFGIGIWVI